MRTGWMDCTFSVVQLVITAGSIQTAEVCTFVSDVVVLPTQRVAGEQYGLPVVKVALMNRVYVSDNCTSGWRCCDGAAEL
jgi:hypothetical protein